LRERIKKELTSPRAVERRIPHENERVLLNEPDTPRGMWKLVRIKAIKRRWDEKNQNSNNTNAKWETTR
ncbi:unnamed protein product, partial [Onchocerca ochengi]